MSTELVEQRVDVRHHTIIALIHRNGPDLSARQLGVFLTGYVEDEAATVGELAAKLNVSGPAISRAQNRLAEFDLVRRQIDPLDRRSALARRTMTGVAFLRDLKNILADEGNKTDKVPSEVRRAGALVGTG